jgi:hypothetical protein
MILARVLHQLRDYKPITFEDSLMFPTFPRSAFLNIFPAFAVRYALLFAIALFTVVMSPSISNYASNYVSNGHWLPWQTAIQSEQVSLTPAPDYAFSMTHQEPNFYQ